MTFAQRRNCLTAHFSEHVVGCTIWVCVSTLYDVRTTTKLRNDAFLRTCSGLYYLGLCKYTLWRSQDDEIA